MSRESEKLGKNMANSNIHIFGVSGSGTSTLGEHIATQFDYAFMDTDDYYWKPTNPHYKKARPISERLTLMNDDAMISDSLFSWSNSLIPKFTLAVRLVTDSAIRLERLNAIVQNPGSVRHVLLVRIPPRRAYMSKSTLCPRP